MSEKLELYSQYSEAMKTWAGANDDFINPNPYIQQEFDIHAFSDYMEDRVHPNATAGVELYCRAVFLFPQN